jgi:hypothetical protein
MSARKAFRLPAELEQLIDKTIERMSDKEFRDFEKQAMQVMKDSTRRVPARRPRRKKGY